MNKNFEVAKNKQSNLVASVKMLNIGFINKYIINLGGGHSVLVNYQSLLSTIFPLDSTIIFLYKIQTTPCEFYWTIGFYDSPTYKQEN